MNKALIIVFVIFLCGCVVKGKKEFNEIKKKAECNCIYSDTFGVTCECFISKEDVPETKRLMKKLQKERR